jgi:hypothetical protein
VNRFVRSGVVALALCAFSLVGCETKRVWLQLTGLDDGITEGVWLWSLSKESGTYERACRFWFAGIDAAGGLETLGYTQDCEGANDGFELRAPVKRSESRPGTIAVGLVFMNLYGTGVYKISSYGRYGETSLSESTIQL